jgi:hypothetical protein
MENKKVFIVEDDFDDYDYFKSILSRFNYEVIPSIDTEDDYGDFCSKLRRSIKNPTSEDILFISELLENKPVVLIIDHKLVDEEMLFSGRTFYDKYVFYNDSIVRKIPALFITRVQENDKRIMLTNYIDNNNKSKHYKLMDFLDKPGVEIMATESYQQSVIDKLKNLIKGYIFEPIRQELEKIRQINDLDCENQELLDEFMRNLKHIEENKLYDDSILKLLKKFNERIAYAESVIKKFNEDFQKIINNE